MISMAFSIFTRLYNHHPYLVPKHFSVTPKEILYPLAVTPNATLPQTLANSNLLSVSLNLPIMKSSCEWNHITCGL